MPQYETFDVVILGNGQVASTLPDIWDSPEKPSPSWSANGSAAPAPPWHVCRPRTKFGARGWRISSFSAANASAMRSTSDAVSDHPHIQQTTIAVGDCRVLEDFYHQRGVVRVPIEFLTGSVIANRREVRLTDLTLGSVSGRCVAKGFVLLPEVFQHAVACLCHTPELETAAIKSGQRCIKARSTQPPSRSIPPKV